MCAALLVLLALAAPALAAPAPAPAPQYYDSWSLGTGGAGVLSRYYSPYYRMQYVQPYWSTARLSAAPAAAGASDNVIGDALDYATSAAVPSSTPALELTEPLSTTARDPDRLEAGAGASGARDAEPAAPEPARRPGPALYFPVMLGHGGEARGAGSEPGGAAVAVANAYSTGRGGVATSHATAYGAPPASLARDLRRQQPAP